MLEKIKKFENETGYEVIYVTKYGSKLYGTDSETSDTDYKGLFMPTMEDVLMKRDLEHWTSNSNNSNEKNSNDDVDLQLFSVFKFFNLLKKGETGALDILFSMFRFDTIMIEDKKYTNVFREHYKEFYNRNLNSFVGYAIGQSKKFNIKGNRYKELLDFKEKFYIWSEKRLNNQVKTSWEEFKGWVENEDYKYIKFVWARGPMTSLDRFPKIEYLEVLGSKFPGSMSFGELYTRVHDMEAQFGNRTRASANSGVDWKGLSHACRVILEVEELLDTGFITFPLREKDFVKAVKSEKLSLENVMTFLDAKLDIVNAKMESTTLPEKSNEELTKKLWLRWLENEV